MLATLLASASPAGDSPAVRFTGASAAFSASVTIRRDAAEVGPGKGNGNGYGHVRKAELTDSAGQPVPALITDFE